MSAETVAVKKLLAAFPGSFVLPAVKQTPPKRPSPRPQVLKPLFDLQSLVLVREP
jgi:hypothetical protein